MGNLGVGNIFVLGKNEDRAHVFGQSGYGSRHGLTAFVPLHLRIGAGPGVGEKWAEVLAAVKKSVRAANAQLAAYEQIKKFRVLPVEFSIEGGELTPTMKVRRSKVLEKFADKVAEMYAAKDDLL